MEKNAFPQFRHTPDGKHIYRIESTTYFIEWQVVGSRVLRHEVHAVIFPEKVRVLEMLDGAEGRYMKIGEHDFERMIKDFEP